jgi:threonine dehydratase
MLGAEVWCKLDLMQATGSFKERGARHALLSLGAAQRERGVISASAGNHALALAFHGKALGVPVTVVMPRFAPLVKQVRCRQYGARVLLHGENIADAREHADSIASLERLAYINGFNDPAIIAGAGTCALEAFEQIHDLDAIVTPVGGGGLVAGIVLAAAAARPTLRIIGVESARCPSMTTALREGKPVRVAAEPSLADGLGVPEVGATAFEILQGRVESICTVGEDSITRAILRLLEHERVVAEGAAATPVAAMMEGQLESLRGRRICMMLCGGNIDPTVLARVIEHGLALDGRMIQFLAVIRDRPGGLAELASAIASAGASVKQVSHERAFGDDDVSRVQVLCQIEVRGPDHAEEVFSALRSRGIEVLARGSLRQIATHG